MTEEGYFHLRYGFCFRRGPDGRVTLFVLHPTRSAPIAETTVSASEWASVLAAMCARGESAATWQEACDFHDRAPE